ncbi:MAG TPA: hypothetical protein VN654_12535 [Vicinamibacterales bacterium]|nr:hypothetical protein [Vicinamibacterales bacterium]
MRVKIIEQMSGTLDGIDLTKFQVGHVYDVGVSFASYLLASRYATPVADERSASDEPLDRADDRERRKRRT